jgi:hypothetical protein
VEISPVPGETILFFCIDKDSRGDSSCSGCNLRKDLWGDKQGERICDLLVFYANEHENRRVLCFVELKDSKSDLGDATDQIINTYRAIKTKLRLSNQYSAQAFLIGHHGSAPTEHREHQNKLNKEFKNNFVYSGNPEEFAPFLRGADKQELLHGRKKKKK